MIRPLGEQDLDAYLALRRQSLIEVPLAFVAAPGDDFAGSADAVREQLRKAPEWMLFGAFRGELAGAVGVMREPRLKAAHRAHVWGMYVAPHHRRAGLGRGLLEAAIAHGRSLEGVAQLHITVTDAAAEARRLYERAGFRVWGVQPDALRHDGRSTDEHHMLLRLDGIF